MSAANSSHLAKGDVIWVINPQGVRLRDKPDVSAPTLETLRFGTRILVFDEPRTGRGWSSGCAS